MKTQLKKLFSMNLALLMLVMLAVPAQAAGDSYRISVGNTVFWSNEDRSGPGWTYTAEDHSLELTDYSGGEIRKKILQKSTKQFKNKSVLWRGRKSTPFFSVLLVFH